MNPRKPRKKPCISLDSFGRIVSFQGVTANPNEKFLFRLHTPQGLWAIVANRSLAPTRAGAPDRRSPSFSLPTIVAMISV
jgi:hypothetical protein